MSTCVLGFRDYEQPAQRLALALGVPYRCVALHRFPDGESRVALPTDLPKNVILCRSLHQPNDKLIELMLASATARQSGVENIALVAPYLCYLRQDCAFRPGEAISQRIVGPFLAKHFDDIFTVDPHLHRVHTMEEAIPSRRAVNISSAPLLASFLNEQVEDPFLLGPDSESEQWVRQIAGYLNCDYAVANKTRYGDRRVKIILPALRLKGRTVVLVDDIVSTGTTVANAVSQVVAAGAKSAHCLVTHALFVGNAVQKLRDAGIQNIWSTDSVPHASNVINLAPQLAKGITG